MLEAKIFYSSVVWTADVVWKCPKAVLETQQWPGEHTSSLKQCFFSFWHEVPVCLWCDGLVEWLLPELLSMKCLLENVWPGMNDDPVRLVRLHQERLELRAAGDIWGWNKWAMLVVQHQLICGASSPPVTAFVIPFWKGDIWQWSHRTRHAWLFRVLPGGFWVVSLELHVLS